MEIRLLGILALLGALILGVAPTSQAALPPLETSRGATTINTDVTARLIVKVKYRDYGYLGVKPIKVCVVTRPDGAARTITVKFRHSFRVIDMGEYKGNTRCKKIPFYLRSRGKQRNWDAWGGAKVWEFIRVPLWYTSYSVRGYMS